MHSDTVMFKVLPSGVYLMLTDSESFCCAEIQLTENIQTMLKLSCPDFSAKIQLDSLTKILKTIWKRRHTAVLFGEPHEPQVLKVREIPPLTNDDGKFVVEKTEFRARVYYTLSTRVFRENSQNYIKLKMQNGEFNKLLTQLAIISGTHGGIGEIRVWSVPNDKRYKIGFSVKSDSGAEGTIIIHACDTDKTVCVQHAPEHEIHLRYLVTYLKRSQNLLSVQTDYLTMFISDKGLLLTTEPKDHHSVMIYISDVRGLDLESYS